jgi:hypothetical protein
LRFRQGICPAFFERVAGGGTWQVLLCQDQPCFARLFEKFDRDRGVSRADISQYFPIPGENESLGRFHVLIGAVELESLGIVVVAGCGKAGRTARRNVRYGVRDPIDRGPIHKPLVDGLRINPCAGHLLARCVEDALKAETIHGREAKHSLARGRVRLLNTKWPDLRRWSTLRGASFWSFCVGATASCFFVRNPRRGTGYGCATAVSGQLSADFRQTEFELSLGRDLRSMMFARGLEEGYGQCHSREEHARSPAHRSAGVAAVRGA